MTSARRVRHAPERAAKLDVAHSEPLREPVLRLTERVVPVVVLLPAVVAVALLLFAVGWVP